MIGLIRFAFQGANAEAVLGDDGSWSCTAVPCLVRPLDILYGPSWEGIPAGGPVGLRQLETAGRWLRGTIVCGYGRPILGTAQRSVRNVPVNLASRRSRAGRCPP